MKKENMQGQNVQALATSSDNKLNNNDKLLNSKLNENNNGQEDGCQQRLCSASGVGLFFTTVGIILYWGFVVLLLWLSWKCPEKSQIYGNMALELLLMFGVFGCWGWCISFSRKIDIMLNLLNVRVVTDNKNDHSEYGSPDPN